MIPFLFSETELSRLLVSLQLIFKNVDKKFKNLFPKGDIPVHSQSMGEGHMTQFWSYKAPPPRGQGSGGLSPIHQKSFVMSLKTLQFL